MALEKIGFIPVDPVGGSESATRNGWSGDIYPNCIRSTKEGAAKAWFLRQTWDINQQHAFFTATSGAAWCEFLGV